MELGVEKIIDRISVVGWRVVRGGPIDPRPVSSLFRGLFSESESEVEHECRSFENNFIIQGELCSGAFYIIPFLIAALKSNIGIGRKFVYELLDQIANGISDLKNEVRFERVFDEFHFFVPSLNVAGVPLGIACHNAVSEGFPIYISDLRGSEEMLTMSLELLYLLPQFYYITKPEINEIIKSGEVSGRSLELLREALITLRRSKV